MVAGEASSDVYAARLARELAARSPGVRLTGIGGPALEAAGAKLIYRMEELAVMGFAEVIPKLGFIMKVLRDLKRLMAAERPALVVLLDFPDFNLRLAKAARGLGVKVLYYIGPQVWAWRPSRASAMGRLVNHVALILPFEPPVWQSLAPDLPASFVGHPLLDEFAEEEARPRELLPVPQDATVVGLVPGSRAMEIRRMLPLFMESARRLVGRMADRPAPYFLLPRAPGLRQGDLEPFMRQAPPNLTVLAGRAREVMRRSQALMITSGTATLEAALAGTPMVVVYKTGWFNFALASRLVKVEHISLPNLIAGREVVPELIQKTAQAQRLSDLVYELLTDQPRREAMKQDLAAVRDSLGAPGAGGRVADLAFSLMEDTAS
jgi:lipid-A-disaccharide synthase